MSEWSRRIPNPEPFRKAHIEALEAQLISLRRWVTKRTWTPVDVEAETPRRLLHSVNYAIPSLG